MVGCCRSLRVLLIILTLLPLTGEAAWWFWSSTGDSSTKAEPGTYANGVVAEFSMEGLNNPNSARLVESARNKLMGSNSCWHNAYGNLFAGCSEILAAEEKRSRFAWHLADCFQRDSGRSPFPYCGESSSTVDCRKKLDNSEANVFLQFYLETNSICHQLQAYAFKRETERLVTNLKDSAEDAVDKLDNILDKSESLSRSSNELRESLSSIDLRTQQLSQASKNVEEHIAEVLTHSKAVYEQSRSIAASQSELSQGQSRMTEQLEEGMTKIHDSYLRLDQDIANLRTEAAEVEKEIANVRDLMASKMETLQGKADDIGNMTGASLEKQRELLEGQSDALDGLRFLTEFQSQAMAESRSNIKQLAEYTSNQQQELLERQKQLHEVHDHLVQNSKSILASQEAFESKQATMFVALDKLFALHNAMLLESRVIKAFFIYALSIFVIYMFTSTKQTYNVRPWLYIGLCVTLLIEVTVLRLTTFEIEQQANIISFFRCLYAFLASAQLLHAIFTYRDYETLNHQMLITLMEKVNYMQRADKLSWETDSDVDWSEWIDSDLPAEVGTAEDPDFEVSSYVRENSFSSLVRKEYNLRQRLH